VDFKKFIVFFAMLFALGCSDYKISPVSETSDPGIISPEIEVDPLSHSFGALSAGSETGDIVITIRNIGNDDLNISDIYVQGLISNFYISSSPVGIIEPLDSAELIVSYDPMTYETNSEIVTILSNDSDEPSVDILLDGSGDAPVITITPEYRDFGNVYLGCDETETVIIGNIGNSNLIISDIEYFATVPVDFLLQEYESTCGTLPITIEPGDSIDLQVDYSPIDDLDDSAYIEVISNDPLTPRATSSHDGLGDYENWITDSFIQDGTVDVDILFVIDNSGSMGSNQTNLENNFDTFMNAFTAAGVSYQIALITTDSYDFVGDIITPSTPDPVVEFNTQVDSIGTRGSTQEAGLWAAHQSTTVGDASPGSATGFFRPTARLVVVYVSDEPDWSSYRDSSMDPADYSASLLSLKSSPALVAAHAIAGDHPSGCSSNGGAQFGDGYYDVVNDLGGTFMSICASDWSTTMDTLARESIAMSEFPLSGNAIEDTISVYVNGFLSSTWSYDSSSNSIYFTTVPADGSDIDISYAIWSCQ
tara:strand:+ start:9954 stop:11555 length:1602 start_codon:yes stop_codon:yes gene_type:complete